MHGKNTTNRTPYDLRGNRHIAFITSKGISSERFTFGRPMPDEKDRVFYEIALSRDDSFLVTGNLKHFPKEPKVISPAEMVEILNSQRK